MSRAWHRAQLLASVVLILVTALLSGHALMPPEVTPACEYKTPILCAELARDNDDLARVLSASPNQPKLWALNIAYDMPFIAAYTVLLVGIVRVRRPVTTRASWTSTFFVLAAIFDVLENLGILYALSGGGTYAFFVRMCALLKFSLLSLGGAWASAAAMRTVDRAWLRISWRIMGYINVGAVAAIPFPPVREAALLAVVLTSTLATVEAVTRRV